jgi:hypothetical protein
VLLSALLLSDSSHCPCSFRQARGDHGLGPFALSRRSLTETGASQRLLPVRLASLPLQLLLLPEPPISQARGDLAFGPSHHYHHEDWRFSAPASYPTCFRCPPLQPDPRQPRPQPFHAQPSLSPASCAFSRSSRAFSVAALSTVTLSLCSLLFTSSRPDLSLHLLYSASPALSIPMTTMSTPRRSTSSMLHTQVARRVYRATHDTQ